MENKINNHTSDNDRTQLLPYNFIDGSSLGVLSEDKSISTDPKWNAVNVEMGQLVDYGRRVNVRYHGGLHYANLKLNTGARFTGSDEFGGDVSTVISGESKTNLVGPRLGVDTSYALAKGFSVYANGALAMLVGDNKFLLIYFVGGIMGNILYLLLGAPLSIAVGASGAVYAVAGTLVVLIPNSRVHLYFIFLRTR